MLTPNFSAIEFGGHKFDRGMNLFEFDTIRAAPNADISTYTGSYKDSGRFGFHVEQFIRSQIEVNEIQQPQMLMDDGLVPDACITNVFPDSDREGFRKLIAERMSRKILGIEYNDIAEGYYRAGWLPPPVIHSTLRPVKFHYPTAGYFGALAEKVGCTPGNPSAEKLETTQINIAFLTGFPSILSSVLFVVRDSPIYRITNQEICSGKRHTSARIVVEFRGHCDIPMELWRLGYCYASLLHGQISINLPLPTRSNLDKKPDLFCNSLNDQILRSLNGR